MTDYETVFAAAASLPLADRLRLIDELASSVPDMQPPHLSAAWQEVVARRCDEIDAGTVSTEDWSKIRERLFAKHGTGDAS